MNANKATEKVTGGEVELQAFGNVWESAECVNSMQSICAKDPEPKGKSDGGMRKGSSDSLDSLDSASGRSSDESPTPPSEDLTNEHNNKGRILMNQVFNELEILEMDRVYYESILKIAPLLPVRQLLRCTDFDDYSVAQMLSETTKTKRQFVILVCFLNAMHGKLQKAKAKAPAKKSQVMLNKMVNDAENTKIALTGKPSTPERKSKGEQSKTDAEKGVQKLLGKVTSEWENILRSIQALKNAQPSKQFKNLELMPFYMEKLVKVLEEARLGIWLIFSEVQIALGKSPIQRICDPKYIAKKNVCTPLSERNHKF